MSNPDELALVKKALNSGLGGCVEWDPRAGELVRSQKGLLGLTPEMIISATIEFVQNGGRVHQVKETRQRWKDKRDYWYKVIIPIPEFVKGIFVEMELFDDDPDLPEVRLVNAHEQK